MTEVSQIPIRSLAHLGDAVYEVFIREKTINLTVKPDKLHKFTVSLVNAEFQADLLEQVSGFVNEKEFDIVRRARNLQTTTARRTNHTMHRLSTGFEALIGYLYITDKNRLNQLYDYITPFIQAKIDEFMIL